MLMVMLGYERDEVACGLTEFAYGQFHNFITLFTYYYYYYYYYYTIWMSLVTGLFFPVLLLNQR